MLRRFTPAVPALCYQRSEHICELGYEDILSLERRRRVLFDQEWRYVTWYLGHGYSLTEASL
jgi:hypothetical protein